jgi:3-deoxy-D-manno-octulosonate 8-phosphate phosphatase (KDO 8-P phosphatase)
MDGLKDKAGKIKLLLLDVDGVMTDGGIILGGGTIEIKRFHVQDGLGITLARQAGLQVGILTSRSSEVVERRARELGIEEVSQGCPRKLEGYHRILEKYGLRDGEVAYIGDDLPDLPVLRRVGLAFAVANAVPEVKRQADYVTRKTGGEGAVREVVEFLLNLMEKREEVINRFLRDQAGE